MVPRLSASGELRAHERRARRSGAVWVTQQGDAQTAPTEPLWTWEQLGEHDRQYLCGKAKYIAAHPHERTVDLAHPPNPVRDIEFPEEAGVWGPPTVPGTFTLPETLAYGFLLALYHVACPHPLQWRAQFRRPRGAERGSPQDIVNAVYWCPCCQQDVPHHKQTRPIHVLGGANFECPTYGYMHEAPFSASRGLWYMYCPSPWGFLYDVPQRPSFPSYDDRHTLQAREWDPTTGHVHLWELLS